MRTTQYEIASGTNLIRCGVVYDEFLLKSTFIEAIYELHLSQHAVIMEYTLRSRPK